LSNVVAAFSSFLALYLLAREADDSSKASTSMASARLSIDGSSLLILRTWAKDYITPEIVTIEFNTQVKLELIVRIY